ncbi:2TM domain-containing protein [Mesonia aestuariivivens]|uniref:2TM domain-containing protein n=1 Tax=Mesonia aestuariivivens TaxID=2796128 RepID=A0ABS6W2R7_9FLAO|nr:2TM domain-containing protein [Mesonia aestuariivivens]MBW2962145.1 2TM domain-containing protein [Mesonia aestuariivivens]
MASAEKKTHRTDIEQRELFENAQRRIKQKKRLTTHFVIFIAGSILFIILNVVLDFGKEFQLFGTDWFVWAILLWFFFFLIHAINVFFVNKLMGKEWENKQLERLVAKQKDKILKLQQQVEKEHPLPTSTSNSSLNA